MRKLLTLSLLAAQIAPAMAAEKKEINPGQWRASPYVVKKAEDGGKSSLRIRNLDAFAKICHLQVRNGKSDADGLFADDTLLFKADRALEFPIGLPADLNPEDLILNMGCLAATSSDDPKAGPQPDASACGVDDASCDHLCPADSKNADACRNDHLVIAFDRSSFKADVAGDELRYEAQFKNNSNDTLTCQFLTAAKGINSGTGDTVYVQLSSAPQVLKAGGELRAYWKVSREEMGNSDKIDTTRPRMVGTCTKGAKELSPDFYTGCHPLKRSECNWVEAQ